MTPDRVSQDEVEALALRQALRQLAEATTHEAAPDAIEAALLTSFRTRTLKAESRRFPEWLAFAAALVLAIGGGAMMWMIRDNQPDQQAAVTHARTPVSDVPATHQEIVHTFVPLPYGGGTSYLESGHVVRMELPRSALIAVGVAVPAEQWTERLQADVLFGEDGLARAVRFVGSQERD